MYWHTVSLTDALAILCGSVQTVSNAYKELERDGLIRCEVGRGSFVSRSMTEQVSAYMLDYSERSIADFSTSRIIHTPEHEQAWRETCAELGREDDQPWMRDCRPIAGFERHRVAAAARSEETTSELQTL